MADKTEAVDVNTATAELISLLPDDFVDRGMAAIDAPSENSEETQEPEEEEEQDAPEGDESETPAEEDAPAEDEGDAEAEEADGDEEDDAAEDEPPLTFKVKVDGKESEVSADELVAGYQRQADYTRKTMKLAEERKAFEAEAHQTRELRDEYAARLDDLKKVLDRTKPQEPDWERLRRESPEKFAAEWAAHSQRKELEQALEAEQAQVREKQQKDFQAKYVEHIRAEQEKLLTAVPEWKDAKVRKAEHQQMLDFAETLGITRDDIAQFSDHRALLLLRMAAKYAELQTTGKKVVKEKGKHAPVLRPGQPKPRVTTRRKDIDAASKRLKKTGRVDDAAALFMKMPPDDV